MLSLDSGDSDHYQNHLVTPWFHNLRLEKLTPKQWRNQHSSAATMSAVLQNAPPITMPVESLHLHTTNNFPPESDNDITFTEGKSQLTSYLVSS